MLMLPALSRLMQLHSHKVIGEIIIAVSANLTKKKQIISAKKATDMKISPHMKVIGRKGLRCGGILFGG